MAINKVNTTAEEKSFKFLTTQSTILRTAETNNITINGVNVIVEKPKVGDVMCVTKYKSNSGTLLGADKQKVIWIDGLSINPDKLSEEYEPVGICMVVNGNKALVKYRGEQVLTWSARPQTLMELPNSELMNSGTEQSNVNININGSTYSYYFSADDTSSRYNFVKRLNEFFNAYDNRYSAELVELDSEIPVSYVDCDKTQNSYYTNRVIITSSTPTTYFSVSICGAAHHTIIEGVKENPYIYRKNGFSSYSYGNSGENGCNFARYYESCYTGGLKFSPGNANEGPLDYSYFEKYKDSYSFLHTFDNYEDYIDSFMIKYPCGKGIIGDDPSGKESTYKLGNSTFYDNTYSYGSTSYIMPLYPAAYYATNISVNAPNLGKGNWWIPSVSEMAQMMRDITYGTSAWVTKPDIVNTVLYKLNVLPQFDNTSLTDISYNIFTSSFSKNTYYDITQSTYSGSIYYYGIASDGQGAGSYGAIGSYAVVNDPNFKVTPITIYEF